MIAVVVSDTVAAAIVTGVLALPPAYWAVRRALRQDRVVEQAGLVTAAEGSIKQVIEGAFDLAEGHRVALEDCRRQLADLDNRLPRAPDIAPPGP